MNTLIFKKIQKPNKLTTSKPSKTCPVKFSGKVLLLTAAFLISNFFFSCTLLVSPQQPFPEEPEQITISRQLTHRGQLSATQLARYFLQQNPNHDPLHILEFAMMYIQEANAENINSDVAFAQMCLETGYLRFGGLVQPEWHNYCGLGAMDAENPGCIFPSERIGIRAHIQHLQAYATTEDVSLNNELVDPRYSWVHKTKYVQDIYGLAGTWATDKEYGNKINNILVKMEQLASKF